WRKAIASGPCTSTAPRSVASKRTQPSIPARYSAGTSPKVRTSAGPPVRTRAFSASCRGRSAELSTRAEDNGSGAIPVSSPCARAAGSADCCAPRILAQVESRFVLRETPRPRGPTRGRGSPRHPDFMDPSHRIRRAPARTTSIPRQDPPRPPGGIPTGAFGLAAAVLLTACGYEPGHASLTYALSEATRDSLHAAPEVQDQILGSLEMLFGTPQNPSYLRTKEW